MAQSPEAPAEARSERINLHEPSEVRLWARKLGVTEDELRRAVHRVGALVKDVVARLKK